ncbi:hypothetical protein N7532_011163 [Penicillium argentinense]|uniref:Nucleolar protein 12 n=1 Tax=Penicillium argentinense TaxID=1131581 RepID=A0A9W9EI50_9EURO|nr:uncharacterized protein N7532_011163 [Penicillium argentinense]KAJ5082120.1 hypothetical protein N7532_011163 [Penicillium argentinense]
MGPAAKRRKVSKTEEVNFDPDARHDFLTGFRKRKQQRIKHAQSAAEKRYREERRQDRARLREERAKEYKQVMEEHQRQLKRLKEEDGDDSSDSNPNEDEDDEEWEGIEEPPAVDYEAEYIDEDKYTTVTVEEMDASREGLRKAVQQDDTDGESEAEEDTAAQAKAEPEKLAKKTKKRATDRPKKKKQFRYESKQDRKLNMAKQRLSKARKASKRKEQ